MDRVTAIFTTTIATTLADIARPLAGTVPHVQRAALLLADIVAPQYTIVTSLLSRLAAILEAILVVTVRVTVTSLYRETMSFHWEKMEMMNSPMMSNDCADILLIISDL